MLSWDRVVPFVGRLLLVFIFLLSGLWKIFEWSATAAYMASEGLPLVPVLLLGAIVVEVVGGLAVLFRVYARWAALVLLVYLIPVTLIFHDFWAVPAEQQQTQLVLFLKNLAIMGGLLNLYWTDRGVAQKEKQA